MFRGNTLALRALDNDFVELCFDSQTDAINKLDTETLGELVQALDILDRRSGLRGLLVTSSKRVFIVGADITEFSHNFAQPESSYRERSERINRTLTRFAGLPLPVVVAINGFAMGGGLELALACDYRIMSSTTRIGLPETRLGLIPGWGGTVRLPRLIGFEGAVDWIAHGVHQDAATALVAGAVDGVAAPAELRDEALKLLRRCADGDSNHERRRELKAAPLPRDPVSWPRIAETARASVAAQVGDNYPAPIAAVDVMVEAAEMGLEQALQVEREANFKLTRTPQCRALVGLFLGEQYTARVAREQAAKAPAKVAKAAVLGAGIMGGGIAYQNAVSGLPVIMKDIRQEALDAGLREAGKLLAKNVARGLMSRQSADAAGARIISSLSYQGIESCDIVVEAVVENPTIKAAVITEVEGLLRESTIIASNTSTISITRLARGLKRPDRFGGLHFFNPVHAMPLVEIIRGDQTSEATISTLVDYALALGKKPLVVNDCPGFLVNRVLFPYFSGFNALVSEGADFRQIDRVMERWGWPMGPAYLLDVVGMDTAVHGAKVMAEGFPERMQPGFTEVTEILLDNNRLGQKNGAGFYSYETDAKGKPAKLFEPQVLALFAGVVAPAREFADDEIIARMMAPMCTELARCLAEKIVASPTEADMGLINGLGFPRFRGGVFRWLDEIGLDRFFAMVAPYHRLGELYQPTPAMRAMAANGQRYYA